MGRKETTILITIAVNLGLIGLKFLLAGVSGSLSLRASAWHSFSDVFVSGIVLAGLLHARRNHATAQGVSRIEHGVSLLVALFIVYIGFDIFRTALSGEEPELQNVFWVALAALLTIALSYFMARYKTYVGRATNSPSLVADGYHSLMDMYSSIVVVAGLFGYAIGFSSLDKVAAVVVVLFIAYAGYEIARDALAGLSGREHIEPFGLIEPQRLLRAGVPFLVTLVALYLLTGVYTIQPGEVGIMRRFGKLAAADVPPGLHYRLPWPVDEVTRVPVAAVQRATVPRSLMLTGDENLVNIAATVHYRVQRATVYVFNVGQPADLVRYAAEASLRQTVGLRAIDDLLTIDKEAIQDETRQQLQARLDTSLAGLEVLAVQLTEASPPEEVASAFLDVASAREDRATYINEAQGYQNEILPKARGAAAKQFREAEGYKAERIANAAGEAQRFASRLAAYKNAPAVTRTRLYLEAVERVLPNVQKFLLSPEVGNGNLDLWFSRGVSAPMLLPSPGPQPSTPPRR
ncbi:MAG: FtsH protease activity modulator HflK [Candidatus Entotheonellia bacterium]